MDLITDALGCGVVWSERTGRLVLPMAAERDGDRRTRYAEVSVVLHPQDRVMGRGSRECRRLLDTLPRMSFTCAWDEFR